MAEDTWTRASSGRLKEVAQQYVTDLSYMATSEDVAVMRDKCYAELSVGGRAIGYCLDTSVKLGHDPIFALASALLIFNGENRALRDDLDEVFGDIVEIYERAASRALRIIHEKATT